MIWIRTWAQLIPETKVSGIRMVKVSCWETAQHWTSLNRKILLWAAAISIWYRSTLWRLWDMPSGSLSVCLFLMYFTGFFLPQDFQVLLILGHHWFSLLETIISFWILQLRKYVLCSSYAEVAYVALWRWSSGMASFVPPKRLFKSQLKYAETINFPKSLKMHAYVLGYVIWEVWELVSKEIFRVPHWEGCCKDSSSLHCRKFVGKLRWSFPLPIFF